MRCLVLPPAVAVAHAPVAGCCGAVSDAGEDNNLLKLEGTVPTVHQGHTYHTPLKMYIPLRFPHEAPIVFVPPTAGVNRCLLYMLACEADGCVVGGPTRHAHLAPPFHCHTLGPCSR